ncbi:MAG: phenylalanine--tRNA ligase subunit beta [Armatimonadota bacterium]|nr:phenylalanine--tRNA ligase subunit beta [Armatimonadota bacterium]MDR7443808.1 phenylalanine--tRNA ligase subunit beta [Armatimonadota bacterium]MDR7569023.1 phenylalanine--tRNA ligase subunit beta [Armatimonadota bacterium]MDR7613912.1 phenylalanine--tRNA ligase subunit beta [Armatimonadota bacterium]
MRVPWTWLRELVRTSDPLDPEAWVERFPMLGLGVEAVERWGDDWVFDLETTTNRPDWLGMVGIAREVAAATGGELLVPSVALEEEDPPAQTLASVTFEDPDLCYRYVARVIVEVQVGPAPRWMADRLEKCGIRSINNVVDITNYVMLELGQPLHAFDYEGILGGRIVVRAARAGERLVTLDGVERVLPEGALVIADAERPVALGGIMGGADTEIRPTSRRVLLESAWFNPVAVRRTARAVGLRTEASTRHERGGDPERVRVAAARAAELMRRYCGGRVLRGEVDVYPNPESPRVVALRYGRLRRVLGAEIPREEAEEILRRLGFDLESLEDRALVRVPSHRRDVEREEDLIEEVARLWGYDRIPETMPVAEMGVGRLPEELAREREVRETLLRGGLTEVFTLSLLHPRDLDRVRIPPDHPLRKAPRLLNPLTEEHTHLRTTLLPSLLEVLRTNRARGIPDVHIFEIGRVYFPSGEGWEERKVVGIARMGRVLLGRWNLPEEFGETTFYHLKGVLETLLEELHIPDWRLVPESAPWLHPYRAASLWIGRERIGWMGEVHPQVAEAYDLRGRAYVAEVALMPLLAHTRPPQLRPLPRYPAVDRDLAVVVREGVTAAELVEEIRRSGGPVLEAVEPFDVYTGPQVPAGHKSIAFSLRFRSPDRTLEAREVEAVLEGIRQGLRQRFGARIRGA